MLFHFICSLWNNAYNVAYSRYKEFVFFQQTLELIKNRVKVLKDRSDELLKRAQSGIGKRKEQQDKAQRVSCGYIDGYKCLLVYTCLQRGK